MNEWVLLLLDHSYSAAGLDVHHTLVLYILTNTIPTLIVRNTQDFHFHLIKKLITVTSGELITRL